MLLGKHVHAQPASAATLRLVHEGVSRGRRVRVVTSIRREPFAYREDSYLVGTTAPPAIKVTDGRLAWVPRGDGSGVPMEGNPARNFLVRAFVEGRLYLDHGRWARGSRLCPESALEDLGGLPGGFPAGRQVVPVDFQTAAAVTARLEFDAGDHRLLGYHEPHLDREAWTRYGDWREYGRLVLPRQRVSGWKHPDRRFALTLTAVELDPQLAARLFAGHPLEGAASQRDGGELAVGAGSVPGTAWLLARSVRINGRPAGAALVDTGASTSSVVPALADAIGLPAGGAFLSEAFVAKTAGYKRWIDRLEWGRRQAHQVTVVAADFAVTPEMVRTGWPRFVLGGEELLADGPVLDLREGRLRYRGSPVDPLRSQPGAGRVIEVQATRDRPGSRCLHVPVRVRGVSLDALFDTGFPGALFLTARGADRAGVPRDPAAWGGRAFAQEVGGLGASTRMDLIGPLEGFEVGPLRFEGVWVQVQMQKMQMQVQMQMPAGAATGDDGRSYEALVGAGALLSFPRIGIDTDRSVIEFELPQGLVPAAGGRVRVSSPGEFLGVLLAATEEHQPPRIRMVLPGSPAARAGLEVGERVWAVGGTQVASRDLPRMLRRLWRKPGEDVVLEVRSRANEPRRVVIR